MKNIVITAIVATGLLMSASPAFAMSSGMDNPRLKFANDWARATARFTIEDRTFLVQENPQTPLEIKTKIFWLESQQNENLRKELLNTF